MSISISISTQTLSLIAKDKKILYARVVLERLELPRPLSPSLHSPLSSSPTWSESSLTVKDDNISDEVVLERRFDVLSDVVYGPKESSSMIHNFSAPAPSPQAKLNTLDWSEFSLSASGYMPSEKEESENSTRSPYGPSSHIHSSTSGDPLPSPGDQQHSFSSNDSKEKKIMMLKYSSKPKAIKCTSCFFSSIHKSSLRNHYKKVHNLDWHQVKDFHEDTSFNLKKYCKWCFRYFSHIERHLSTCKSKQMYGVKKTETKLVVKNQTFIPLANILRDVKDRYKTMYTKWTVKEYTSKIRGFLTYCEAEDSNFKVSRMFDESPVLHFIPISLLDTYLEGKQTHASLYMCWALNAFLEYLNYWSLKSDGNKLARNEDKFHRFIIVTKKKISCLIKSLRRKANEESHSCHKNETRTRQRSQL